MKYTRKKSETIFTEFFTIKKDIVSHDLYEGGVSKDLTRYAIDKGPAVACIIYLEDIDKYVLIKQFRYPVLLAENTYPWIYEIVAGTIDGDESPEDTAIKEIQEEAGIKPNRLELIQKLFLSPGISSELIYLYYVEAKSTNRLPTGDPLDDEEDIQIQYFSYEELLTLRDSGQLIDAKTLAALTYISQRRLGNF